MTEDATFYVYLMSRLDGRPCYVGKGRGNRWSSDRGRNKHLFSIMNQAKAQGQKLPCVKVWEGLTEAKAFQCERALIAFFGRENSGTGLLVNLTDGGEGFVGGRHTPESRAIASARLKGIPKTPQHAAAAGAAQRGGTKSSGWWSTDEGRAKQKANNPSSFQKGHKHSPETIEKIKAARAKQTNIGGPGVGYHPTPETRAKLSASTTASWAKRKASQAQLKTQEIPS